MGTNKKKQRREEKKILIILFLTLFIAMLNLSIVLSETLPEGPTQISIINSTRRAPQSAATLNAIAGNVTQLNIAGTTLTQTWQGYYGNVSGTITLDDASNYTLYDWSAANPEGEVYAATSTLSFSSGNIMCFNYSDDIPEAYTSLTELEQSLGLDAHDADGVNETFRINLTHESFYVGTNLINGSNATNACPAVRLYNATDEPTAGLFEEVLLYDKTNNKAIYTALIENDQTGFSNITMDFQMLVGENGHSGDTTTTAYYFYVELE